MSVFESHPASRMAADQYRLLIMGTGPNTSMRFARLACARWARTSGGSSSQYAKTRRQATIARLSALMFRRVSLRPGGGILEHCPDARQLVDVRVGYREAMVFGKAQHEGHMIQAVERSFLAEIEFHRPGIRLVGLDGFLQRLAHVIFAQHAIS